jgi:hypothetical protein
MVLFEHSFTGPTVQRLSSLTNTIRNAHPTANPVNVNIRSINLNPWWKQNHQNTVREIYNILSGPLPSSVKDKIINFRMVIRKVDDISANYIARQTLHVNSARSPQEGEAFMQVLYYVDTPKITTPNGRVINAPNDERGQLLLYRPQNRNHPTIFTPKKGSAVYFTPNDTYHEVTNRLRNVEGPVSRTMIIVMLYKRTVHKNTRNQQERPFHSNFVRAVRTVAGHVRPSSAARQGTSRVPNLERLLGGLTMRNTKKRKANNNTINKTKTKRQLLNRK